MEDEAVAEAVEATVDPPKIVEHNCTVHDRHSCMEWNLTREFNEGKRSLKALESFVRIINVAGARLERGHDRVWVNPATNKLFKNNDVVVVLNNLKATNGGRPCCSSTKLGDRHELHVYGQAGIDWVVTDEQPKFDPELFPKGLEDFVRTRLDIVKQREEEQRKAEEAAALRKAEARELWKKQNQKLIEQGQQKGMEWIDKGPCCRDSDGMDCWQHGREIPLLVFPGEKTLLDVDPKIGDRVRIVSVAHAGIRGHDNPNTGIQVKDNDVMRILTDPKDGWGPGILLNGLRLQGMRNKAWILTNLPITGVPELIAQNDQAIEAHIKANKERFEREKLEREVYVKADDVPPTDWKEGQSWMRALVATPFLKAHGACDPPVRYVRGWPMETPAADIWDAVLKGKPNPLGQRVEFYWFGRILGYVPNLQRELLKKIKEAGWKRGEDAHFEDDEFRRLLGQVITWPELEHRLRESNQYNVTKWETERGFATAPKKEPATIPVVEQEPPAIPVDGIKKNNKGNKKMMNTDRVKHIAAFLTDTAAPALGMKADFSDHLGRRLGDIEEFIEKAARAKGATFTAVDGKTDERMDALETFLKDNAARVNLTYYKFGERAPAKAVAAKANEAAGTDLEARVAKLEAFARNNGYRG